MEMLWRGVLCCIGALLVRAASDFRLPDSCDKLTKIQNREKEWGFFDYLPERKFAELGRFIELTCCATNFDSLTWKVNGVSLSEWKSRLSQSETTFAELRGDLGNQSLYLTNVQTDMEGSYTCEVTKDGDKLYHTTKLYVYATPQYKGPAQMTLTPHDQFADVGDNVTFACEGWFGSSREPWMSPNRLKWSVLDRNDTPHFIDGYPRYSVQETASENRLYIMHLLKVYNVQPEDYGVRFNCLVTNSVPGKNGFANETVTILRPPTSQPRVVENYSYRHVLIGLSVILVVAIILTAVAWNFRLEIRIFLRDQFSTSELSDEIRFGAFFVYSESSQQDSEFVTGDLLDTVEGHMGYDVLISDRDFIPGNAMAEEYVRCMNVSARFVAVLTPDFLRDPWCDFALNVALEAKKNIIFLYLREVTNWDDFSNKDIMQSAVSVMPVVKWPQKETARSKDKFYKRLRLRLPPQPRIEKGLTSDKVDTTTSTITNGDITNDTKAINLTTLHDLDSITILTADRQKPIISQERGDTDQTNTNNPVI